MIKESLEMVVLESLSKNELYEMAKAKNIRGRSKMSRDELIKALKDEVNSEMLVEKSKFDPTPSDMVGYGTKREEVEIVPQAKIDYRLPETYNYDMLMFLPIDAKRAYVCWEITKSKLTEFVKDTNILNFKLVLRLVTNGMGEISRVKVDLNGNYFFSNPMLEDQEAWAEIGLELDGQFKTIMRSNSFKMPAEKISDRDDILYMTVRENVEKIIHLSLKGMDRYYSSIELYKDVLKSISSKNNVEWR